MPAKNSKGGAGLRGEAPPVVMIIAIVLLVIGLGAGGFYAYNGGWKTAGQKDEQYKHEFLPILAAKHGDKEALDAENELRKKNGQPPLEMPKDKGQKAADNKASLADLQKLLTAKQGGQSGQ